MGNPLAVVRSHVTNFSWASKRHQRPNHFIRIFHKLLVLARYIALTPNFSWVGESHEKSNRFNGLPHITETVALKIAAVGFVMLILTASAASAASSPSSLACRLRSTPMPSQRRRFPVEIDFSTIDNTMTP